MENIENKLVNILIDLRENYNVYGVKAEFEAEGASLKEVSKLKELAQQANLDLTIKIGGCESIKELFEAKTLGAKTIIAPMIESPYALKKFAHAIDVVFEEEKINTDFLINIETVTAIENFNSIISDENFEKIDGIVLGRDDLICSMGLNTEEINSDKILDIAQFIANKMQEMNKKFVIGGGISSKFVEFFEKLPENSLNCFETRKIVFNATVQNLKNIETGILKALDFELLWLENKKDFGGFFTNQDKKRIEVLKKRQNIAV